jgi:hypothetical protein
MVEIDGVRPRRRFADRSPPGHLHVLARNNMPHELGGNLEPSHLAQEALVKLCGR